VTPERSYVCTRDKVFALDRARYVQLSAELTNLSAQLKQAEQGSPAQQQISAQIAKLEEDRNACFMWSVECEYPEALILAGEYLIAGGANSVAAFRASDGAQVWSAPVDGLAKGLAAARSRLFVSTTSRRIYCFE